MKLECAPIALFTYNRPWHTKQTVEALRKNELACSSELIIFADAPLDKAVSESVAEVRAYIKSIDGFRSVQIVEREKNLGLARSIISGVTEVVNEYGRVIVLEDDLLTSPYFLKYMNDGLNKYENEVRVVSIHGYSYPVRETMPEAFFLKGADCWGWATWKRGWDIFESNGSKLLSELTQRDLLERFDFFDGYDYRGMLKSQIEGRNDSWAIRWYASTLLQDKLTLYPGKTLVQHIGSDGSGTHCGNDGGMGLFDTKVSISPVDISGIPVKEDQDALMAFSHFLRGARSPCLIKRVVRKIAGVLRR